MNIEEFKKIFLEEAIKNNMKVQDEEIQKLYKYMLGILDWNNKVNVTSITEEKLFIVKHYIDSLLINHYLQGKESIIDIGTGGGFPGIPLKIFNPNKKFTLIDSVNKKLNVIKDLSEKIGLKNLELIHTRAEDLATRNEYREKYDVATTRAVSNLSTILEYMLPFVKVGGIAICMKGPNYKEELDDAKKAIEILGGKLENIESFNLESEMERNILVIKKIKNTPNKFPRGQGKALKEPIR